MNEAKCNCKKMSCDNRFCDRKHTHKTFSCPKCSDMNEDWKEKLKRIKSGYIGEGQYASTGEFNLEELESFIKEQINEAVKEHVEALIWCSGSADFNYPDGQARKGWEKIVSPLINPGTGGI